MGTESLGGKLAGPPSVVSWGPDRMDVFAIAATDATVQHWSWDEKNGLKSSLPPSWTGPQTLPGGNAANLPAEGLSAVSRGVNLLDVFAAGAAGNTPWHWWWDGAKWGGPQPLPGGANLPAERVCAVSSAPNRLDVFAAGAGNLLWHWKWDGLNWSTPESLLAPLRGGGLPAEGVSAVSWGGERLDVFAAVTGPNSLQHWWREGGSGWHIEDLGGNLPQESVTAISPAPGHLDVFAAVRGAGLWHWSQYGGTWSHEELGGNLPAEAVGVVASRPGRLDVFGVAAGTPVSGGELLHWWWDGWTWVGPMPLGGNLPAFDVAAVHRGSDRIDVFAVGSDGSLQHWPEANWSNWFGNQTERPLKTFQPAVVEDLVAEVQAAEADQNGQHVRAVGSGWSFSDISRTPDYLVMTDRLSATLTHVTSSALNANGQARQLYHVEAGIKLRELCQRLDRAGLALPTMGGSAGQSLAGAVSTSVHGGDFDRPPIPDMVQAIHLVAAGGTQHWIERSNPITYQSQLELYVPAVRGNIHYDDDWFNSVLVSMGCMGIIYSLIIEVLPRHYMAEVQHSYPWTQVRGWLKDGTAFGAAFDGIRLGDPPIVGRGALRFLQIVINPHLLAAGDYNCIVTTRYGLSALKQPPPNQWVAPTFAALLGLPPAANLIAQIAAQVLPVLGPAVFLLIPKGIQFAAWAASFPTAGDFLAALMAFAVSHGFPGIVAMAEGIALSSQLPAEQNKQGLSYLLMAGEGEQNLYKAVGVEVAFPTSNDGYLRFVDALLGLATQREDTKPLGGIASLRFTGRSGAYLAIEQWNITCVVEVDLLRGLDGNFEFLEQLEAMAGHYGGILHWGMHLDGSNQTGDPKTDNQNYIDCDAVKRAYPKLETWIDIRRQLTNDGALHTFDNSFSGRCCLNVPADVPITLQVQVTNLVDHINGTPEQLALIRTYPRVSIGDGTYIDAFDTANSIFRKSLLAHDPMSVHIEIWREIRHVIVRGVARRDKSGHWWVNFGRKIFPLPDDYDSLSPEQQILLTTFAAPGPPGVAEGNIRALALAYSHRHGTISGGMSGKAGVVIHVPNGSPNTVEFDLTVGER